MWWLLVRIPGFPWRFNLKYVIQHQWGKEVATSSERAAKELGFNFITFEESGKDMVSRMQRLGLLKDL